MTRTGSAKNVDSTFGGTRKVIADAYRKSAEILCELLEPGDIGNPILNLVILSMIAYADALTAKFTLTVNSGSHADSVSTLRNALNSRFPKSQETIFKNAIATKDTAQYANKVITQADALKSMEDLREFSAWASDLFKRA